MRHCTPLTRVVAAMSHATSCRPESALSSRPGLQYVAYFALAQLLRSREVARRITTRGGWPRSSPVMEEVVVPASFPGGWCPFIALPQHIFHCCCWRGQASRYANAAGL